MATTGKTAWGSCARSEPRWPASLALVVAALLYLRLPGKFTLGPGWLIPALEAAIMVPLLIVAPRRHPREGRAAQLAAFALIGLGSLANVASLVLLIHELIYNGKGIGGPELLFSSIAIWLTNVIVFGLWYWELDRGGPQARMREDHAAPDFLFPQMATPDCTHDDWSPAFFDYLYLSFTNATAFSPTDTLPLTQNAKALMLVESLASLATIAIVASRAINILG